MILQKDFQIGRPICKSDGQSVIGRLVSHFANRPDWQIGRNIFMKYDTQKRHAGISSGQHRTTRDDSFVLQCAWTCIPMNVWCTSNNAYGSRGHTWGVVNGPSKSKSVKASHTHALLYIYISFIGIDIGIYIRLTCNKVWMSSAERGMFKHPLFVASNFIIVPTTRLAHSHG